MEIRKQDIDSGKAFDWGRTSFDYAIYRDIYPTVFYEKIVERKLCITGQKVLDLGTGTGVLPRNMYHYGAQWIGSDISSMQIAQAKKLASELDQTIQYVSASAEDIEYPAQSFDVITACQCFWYFDYEKVMPKLARMLKQDGKLLFLYMAWLPFEDAIAGESESLVLKYSPNWSGARERMHPICVPACVYEHFDATYHEEYKVDVPFTRDRWHGRMKTCRGIEASLSIEEIDRWEMEHKAMLEKIAPEEFMIKHYVAMLELTPKHTY